MPTVLVVDDAADIRVHIRAELSPVGFEVVDAASGVEALDAIGADPKPDIVVLDVQMPDMDGWATLDAIRSQPDGDQLPVILCTVKSRLDDAMRAWSMGADGYLTKPFAIGDLQTEVRRVLARSAEHRRSIRIAKLVALRKRAGQPIT